jgi:hypothetical protein
VTQWISDEESKLGKRHLIAQNISNYLHPVKNVDARISILNFHYAWPEAVTFNDRLGRVIGFDESGFAGEADRTYRRQAWRFILAGGGLFNHLDYSFFVGSEGGTGENDAPGGGSRSLRKQLGILKKFIHRFDFVRMTSRDDLIRSAPGAFVKVLAHPGNAYALYVLGRAPCTLEIEISPGQYLAEWIDTRSGEVLAEGFLVSEGEVSLTSPNFETDVALAIVRRGG